ncbi:MAG: single-stranded DNA-binding protein [Bacillota bacterium]|nr:single-stranded DNA-binding protein [Bacillota bacterium]
MNNINLIARLTKDSELSFIPGSGNAVCKFTVALDDGFKENKKTYYIPIVCYGKIAENTANYTHKGSLVGISGKLTQRSYDNKEGKKVYVFEVVANEVKFLESKGTNNNNNSNEYSAPLDVFRGGDIKDDLQPILDDSMPF